MRREEGRVGNGEAKVSDTDSLSVGIASGRQDGYLANTVRHQAIVGRQRVWWLEDRYAAKDWKGRI